MMAFSGKGYHGLGCLVLIVMASIILKQDHTLCEAAVNSGVIPQAFFDYLEQQQRQRTETTGLKPTTPPPTQPSPALYQPPPPSSPPVASVLPVELPPSTTLPPELPMSGPYNPPQETFRSEPQPSPLLPPPETNPQPPPPPSPLPSLPLPPPPSPVPVLPQPAPGPQQSPSTQQLLEYQDIVHKQQQQLERLKQEIERQRLLLQQIQNPPPPPPPLPKPASNFPAPNYQFKPPPPQPRPPTLLQSPPPPSPPPGVATTRDGVIDFVPAAHKAVAPQPTRYTVTGSMPRDWVARQINPSGHHHTHHRSHHQHYHPLPSPLVPPQAWHRPNLASGANPVTLLPQRHATTAANAALVKKFNPFSHMPLPRTFQSQAMSMGRKMCITQFYESHGCIDPVRFLPPGTKSQGLMMSCSSRSSKQLCSTAGARVPGGMRGRSKNMALAMMMQSPSSRALLEKCLSPNLMTKALTKMMKGGAGGGMNPAAMMMMMGGEGGGGMATLAMMNLMNRQNGRGSTPASGSLPAGAAQPGSFGGGSGGGGGGGGGGSGEECMSILPLIMMKGVDGGMLSAEMATTVTDMRKQLLPYTCQDVHYGVFFRMCCPGKVHTPSMMEMMTHCGG